MTEKMFLSYEDVAGLAARVAERWARADVESVYGVPRGGCVPAVMVAQRLGVPVITDWQRGRTLVVDDIVDSGRTADRFERAYAFDALLRSQRAPHTIAPDALDVHSWVVFPWEEGDEEGGPADAVVRLLQHVGEDPTRPGLVDTPGRVLRAFTEMTTGYADDPASILGKVFDDCIDEMVVVRGIDFVSMCEHHLMPFVGTATVAYVPDQRVVGLSKLARLVECFARRLQVQERMTKQVVEAIDEHLHPLGAACIITARHSCMGCRGVRKASAEMVTSQLSGVMLDKPEARAELLALAR